jgi:hypothetical protein
MDASARRALVAALFAVTSMIVGCGLDRTSDERVAGQGELPGTNAPPPSSDPPSAPERSKDPSTTPPSEPPPSTPAPPPPPPGTPGVESKVIFATQTAVSGRISFGGKEGREAADLLCNDEARKAELAGTYIAWLSKGEEDAIERIPESTAGWKLPSGSLVFPSRAHILEGKGPLVPILRTADKSILVSDFGVWTATYENGTMQNPSCNDWKSTQGTGVGGNLYAVDRRWTNDRTDYCSDQRRIVCFEK